jgi:N-acyl-D-amino-acid deacylase
MHVVDSGKAFVQDGITFWLGGNCGFSPNGTGISLSEWLNEADTQDLYNNYATLSGHNSLRRDVGIGFNEPESPEQIAQMVEILKGDLAAGSFGVSYGTFYDPGGTKEAMIELAKASKAEGGMAASHIREITFDLVNVLFPYKGPAFTPLFYLSQKINLVLFADSLTEAIDTCKEANVPYIVSHLTDMAYNGSITWALDTIQRAICLQGLPMASDVIGYDTFKNDFYALTRYGMIPVRTLFSMAGVKPEQFWMAEDVFVDDQLYMSAYDRLASVEQAEYLATAFKEGRAHAGPDSDSESVAVWCNIVDPISTMLAIKRPFVFMGNDGFVSFNSHTGEADVQPRSYSCFSRLLGHWSRDLGAISMKKALFKATIAPALWLGLEKKGRLQEGCDADITIFNPDTIIDRAKPEAGQLDLPPVGIEYVIVNGQIVVEHEALTGNTPGKIVRRTWQIPGNTKQVMALYYKRFPLISF